MKLSRGVFVLLAALVSASLAHATVGGPSPLTVLGWDAVARRVYVHQHEWNAGADFDPVAYFDLGSAEPARLRIEEWSWRRGEASANDAGLLARLATLMRRLEPLQPEPGTAMPFRSEVVRSDSLDWYGSAVPRQRVRVTWDDRVFVEVDDFREGSLVRMSVWRIPGRSEQVWVIAWMGDPSEGGYEVQRALLVREGETGTRELSRWVEP